MKSIEEYKQILRGWVETRERQKKNNNTVSIGYAQQEINRLQAIIDAMEKSRRD